MPYAINYTEYKEYSGVVSEEEFTKLLPAADAAIETLTMGFYFDKGKLYDDVSSVQFKHRAVCYKKAVAFQIDYYSFLGTTTVAQMNATPSSQSIGATSVSYGDQVRDASGNIARYAAESLNVLEPTGLLYRGVGLCRRYR